MFGTPTEQVKKEATPFTFEFTPSTPTPGPIAKTPNRNETGGGAASGNGNNTQQGLPAAPAASATGNTGNFSFAPPTPEYSFLPKTLETLANDLANVLQSGDRSDITIKCGSTEFKVHEFILAVRSPEFNRLLSIEMLGQEKREMIVTDLEPDTFRTMLKYIYSSNINAGAMDHKQLVELTKAADKYKLQELKEICFTYLTKKLTLANIGSLATLAHRYSAPEPIKKKVFGFCVSNFGKLCKDMEFKEVMKECLDEFFVQLPAIPANLTETN